MRTLLRAWIENPTFWSAFLAWFAAQVAKVLCDRVSARREGQRWYVRVGGMPSAHSAMVGGLTASVAWHCGCGSPVFVLALAFAILTMFDAATVRRAAGLQARLLNEIVEELFQQHHLSERKVRELLGHTRLEVFLGLVMGIEVAVIVEAMFALGA